LYGLMKVRCVQAAGERERRRLHYCGTCKTLGRAYGQRARLLLNHDAVFLGELLSLLSGEDHQGWGRAYQSYNCLALPRDAAGMPLPLRFAAAANIVLTDFKIADHLSDTRRLRWRWARRALSRASRRAADELRACGFPPAELWPLLATQDACEAELTRPHALSADEALARLAGPTARATAMFFEYGARAVGCEAAALRMAALGDAFGRLVYALDAFEDYERDARRSEFNALRAAHRWYSEKLTAPQRRESVARLRRLEAEIVAALNRLPLTPEEAALFAERLRRNVADKLGPRLPVMSATRRASRRMALAERWRSAVALSHALAARKLTARSAAERMGVLLVFVSVLTVALIFPRQAGQAKSWRECLDIPFNLMFVGTAVGAALASTKPVLGLEDAGPNQNQRRKGKKSDCCCEGCCECSEGCCECGCDSCHCCDGCDCCGCDCGH
jgi:hypothetical protein